MTNIWTNTFEEIRKPHFEMEDPYTSLQEKKEGKEGKAKRWWDDDGDGVGYEEGEVEGKFKKKKVKEEFVDEETLYTSKSSQEKIDKMPPGKKNKINIAPEVKEEVEAWVGELVEEGYDLSEFTWDEITNIYLDEAEKWIQKAIKHPGALHRQLDVPSGEKIPSKKLAAAAKKGGTLGKRARLAQTLKGFHKEEIDINEAGTSAMAPKGDYQTTMGTATEKQDPNAPLIAAKARAAKAKVTKEIADLQVAKQSQRLKVDTNEAVIQYLAHRPDAFENLEEGVFDPKKSKMRPASERSERTMTDAQRAAAKKEAQRTAEIHSKGETVLTGLTRPQRRSSQPMGSSQPSKPAAPEANRKVSGKYDQLAKKASSILKSIKN